MLTRAYEQGRREIRAARRFRIDRDPHRCVDRACTVAEPAGTRCAALARRHGEYECAGAEDGGWQARFLWHLARAESEISRESRCRWHRRANDTVGRTDFQTTY